MHRSVPDSKTRLSHQIDEKGLDILSVKKPDLRKSDLFAVTFAYYKASPHFVLVIKQQGSYGQTSLSDDPDINLRRINNPGLSKVTDPQLDELIRVSREVCSSFDLLNGFDSLNMILSIHVGDWVSSDQTFHAHIAFGHNGKQRYLEIFNEIKVQPPMSEFWPSDSEKFITNQWHARPEELMNLSPENIDQLHTIKVENYPPRNQKYGDTIAINMIRDEPVFDTSAHSRLRYHHMQPQVALPPYAETHQPVSLSDLRILIRELEVLADFLKTNVDNCDGCHICVSIGGQGFSGFDGGSAPVLGYLHLSGQTFYKICPEDKRSAWLDNYYTWDGNVYT